MRPEEFGAYKKRMCGQEEWIVPDECGGERLDRILEGLLPGSGLRLRRRLCDERRVAVDGRFRKPGYRVVAGQRLVLQQEEVGVSPEDLGLLLVRRDGGFAAVYKPGGVHSADIAGGSAPSAEAMLPTLFPDASPILLNRLDFLTSGLLLVGLDDAAVQVWRAAEENGTVRKFYVAEVRGRLDGVVTVKNRLDTDDRKKTRVLDEADADPRRWTDVRALTHDRTRNTSRVACLILKGARHQIRAHLAAVDHPILGDPLYGEGRDGERMRLHHRRVELPGFSAEVSAPF